MTSQHPRISAQALAAMAGVPFFETSFFMPNYPPLSTTTWRIIHSETGHDHGYYSGQWMTGGMPALLKRAEEHGERWETWMSLSPHEIESQELAVAYGYGNTVVMGLGMGWVALNMALNPRISSVVVIERDPVVIDLFEQSRVIEQVDAATQTKMKIIQADALLWNPGSPVDFLYADIWRDLAEHNAVAEVRQMQENVLAKTVYFWGQELFLHAALAESNAPGKEAVHAALLDYARNTLRLPLLLPTNFDYGERIRRVAENRRKRGLPVTR